LPGNSIPIFSPQGELCGTVFGYQFYDQLFVMETRFAKPTVVPRHRHENPHFVLVLGGGFNSMSRWSEPPFFRRGDIPGSGLTA
jgi:hypothetical protein